jgi:hypothetical protein
VTAPPPYGPPQPGPPPPYGPPSFAPPPPPPPRRSTGAIVALVLAIVLVLCAGGGVAAFLLLRDDVTAAFDDRRPTVRAPETLGGRERITDPDLQTSADQVIVQLQTEVPDARDTVAAVYGDVAQQDVVMLVAVSGDVDDPQWQLDEALTAMDNPDFDVSDIRRVEPGPLGGVAKCATAVAGMLPVGLCAWSDEGSLGVIATFFRSAEQAEADFVAMRGEVESR